MNIKKDFYYVDSMSYEQIADFIKSDFSNFIKRVCQETINKDYDRIIRIKKRQGYDGEIYFKPIHLKRHNLDYYIIPNTYSYKDYVERGTLLLLFVTFMKDGRLHVAYIQEDLTIVFIEPHLFDRYKERAGVENDNKIDIIIDFLKQNRVASYIDYKHDTIDNSIIVTIKDGVVFGVKNKNYLVYKTYINRQMMFENQHKYICDDHLCEYFSEKYVS